MRWENIKGKLLIGDTNCDKIKRSDLWCKYEQETVLFSQKDAQIKEKLELKKKIYLPRTT